MKLSIIIVNYNVRYFLEQCLLSVEKAVKGIDAEVFVVDNNSVDGSVAMVAEKFPWARLIANRENTGFSKANNQAIRIASGEYILLLNPDTVVEEDTFAKVVFFMDEHPEAGGLGVKMVDGKGNFLPESKRGLPTPTTSFYKIFGISRIFSRSKKFNRYHLGHLDKNETNEIEILSGAFMMMRKSALDKVGLLDEAFFMYGEDIDLSWRIIQGGWKNFYFPGTSIIHYKGESTKKGSLNYVFVFYNAMVIFARKHFSEKNARLFSFFINVAIWLRAGVAVLSRFARMMMLPVIDATVVILGLYLLKNIYASTQHKIYDPVLVQHAFIAYVITWCFSAWIAGAYDKPLRPQKIFKPVLIGSAVILMVYSLLPESLRFSRALIVLGTAIALVVFFANRIIYNFIAQGRSGLSTAASRRFAIVGKFDEALRVKSILSQAYQDLGFVATVSPGDEVNGNDIGNITRLDEIVRVHNIDQVIFCARDVSASDIIGTMSNIDNKSIEFKIAQPESLYIIGSNSIETSGDVLMLDVNSVSLARNKRSKRILDIAMSLLFFFISPVMLLLVKKPAGFIGNIFLVLIGRRSWVGFSVDPKSAPDHKLPRIKPGVLHPLSVQPDNARTIENIAKLNILYARDYRVMNDLSIVWKGRRALGG